MAAPDLKQYIITQVCETYPNLDQGKLQRFINRQREDDLHRIADAIQRFGVAKLIDAINQMQRA